MTSGRQQSEIRRRGASEAIEEAMLRAMDDDPRLASGAGVPRADDIVDYIRMTGLTTGRMPAAAPRKKPAGTAINFFEYRVRDADGYGDRVGLRHTQLDGHSPVQDRAAPPAAESRAVAQLREIIAELAATMARDEVASDTDRSGPSTAPREISALVDADQPAQEMAPMDEPPWDLDDLPPEKYERSPINLAPPRDPTRERSLPDDAAVDIEIPFPTAGPAAPPGEVPAQVDADQRTPEITPTDKPLWALDDPERGTSERPPVSLAAARDVARELSLPDDAAADFETRFSAAGSARERKTTVQKRSADLPTSPPEEVDENITRHQLARPHQEPVGRGWMGHAIGRPYVLVLVIAAALGTLLLADRVGQIEPRLPSGLSGGTVDEGPANTTAGDALAETRPSSGDIEKAEDRSAEVISRGGPYSVVGSVFDQTTGAPIPEASIYARVWDDSLETTYTETLLNSQPHSRTNQAGEFFLRGLRTGSYGLVARHDNYVPVAPAVRHSFGGRAKPETRDIYMVHGGHLEGEVTLNDRPASSASLTLVLDGSVTLRSTTATDSEGLYRFENLPSGAYRLVVAMSDAGQTFRESLRARVESGRATRVDFAFGGRGGTILGRIQPYNPVLTYKVSAERLLGPIEWREADVKVAEDGVFILRELPPGQYRIGVECLLPGRNRWYMDAAAHVRQGEVALADFCFAGNSSIAGRIVNMERNEFLSVWATNRFRVARADPDVVERLTWDADARRARVDISGRFTFEEPLEPGSYMVVAAGHGERYAIASLHIPGRMRGNLLASDSSTFMELELSDDRKKPAAPWDETK